MVQTEKPTPRYDWRACFISIVVGLGVAVPTGLLVTRVAGSALLLAAVVTVVGTAVSRWMYGRVADRGARPLDCDEHCPL
jgi:hypothetical protein